jgi:hypothetical protein
MCINFHNCFNFVPILHKVTFRVKLHVLGEARLLTLTKPLCGFCPIVIGELLHQFTSYSLRLEFYNTFVTHFSPHQFEIANKGECETVIHDIKCTLNLHAN